MKPNTYLVQWCIELEAYGAEDAARIAREIQLDPSSLATTFDVKCVESREWESVTLEGCDGKADETV